MWKIFSEFIYIYNMLLCIIWSQGSDTYYYGVVLVLYARGLLEPERTVEACFSVGLPIQWLLLLLNEIFSKLSGIYHFSEHVSSYNVSNAGVVSAGINELVEHNHDLPLRVGVRKPQWWHMLETICAYRQKYNYSISKNLSLASSLQMDVPSSQQ